MKFATYKIKKTGQVTYGSVIESKQGLKFTDVGSSWGGDLRRWIAADQMDVLTDISSKLKPKYSEKQIEYMVPIQTGEKIICIGVNYAKRNSEYKDNSEASKYPSVFLRYLDSFVGHNQNMLRPPESDKLDYEGEIVIIIGKGGRRIPREQALSHIAGLSLMNEGTLRDWVRHAKFNVTQGKNFEKSGVIGPWMLAADASIDYDDLSIQTRVNGQLRQNDNTSNLMFPFDYIISYLSTFMTLKPGDMISTGTPNGAGARFTPPKFLKPGDRVEVKVDGIGSLKNGVQDEF